MGESSRIVNFIGLISSKWFVEKKERRNIKAGDLPAFESESPENQRAEMMQRRFPLPQHPGPGPGFWVGHWP